MSRRLTSLARAFSCGFIRYRYIVHFHINLNGKQYICNPVTEGKRIVTIFFFRSLAFSVSRIFRHRYLPVLTLGADLNFRVLVIFDFIALRAATLPMDCSSSAITGALDSMISARMCKTVPNIPVSRYGLKSGRVYWPNFAYKRTRARHLLSPHARMKI